MAGPQFAQSFNADDATVVSFETVGDAIGNVAIGVGVIGTKCGVHGAIFGNDVGTRDVPDGTGVAGDGEENGVSGFASLRGVLGQARNRFNAPEDTTGVLGEGYETATGVVGLSFASKQRDILAHGAGVVGASNGSSQRNSNNPDQRRGAGVVGLSVRQMPVPIDTPGMPLPDLTALADGEGTGVWGSSEEGLGVHGQSRSGAGGLFESDSRVGVLGVSGHGGRGGGFESDKQAQVNLVPHESESTELGDLLPFDGVPGDLLVFQGQIGPIGDRFSLPAELWFCDQGIIGATGAHWRRVAFDLDFQTT